MGKKKNKINLILKWCQSNALEGAKILIFTTLVSAVTYCFTREIEDVNKRKEALKSEVRKLWRTLKNVGDLDGSIKRTPDTIHNLKIISQTQKKYHNNDWRNLVEELGTLDKSTGLERQEEFIESLRMIARKHHKESYQIANYEVESSKIMVASDPNIIISSDEKFVAAMTMPINDRFSATTSMVDIYRYSKHKLPNLSKDYPHIKLKDNNLLASLSKGQMIKLKKLIGEKLSGFLYPIYAGKDEYERCFKKDIGVVKANFNYASCRNYIFQFIANLNEYRKFLDKTEKPCEIDIVNLGDYNVDMCSNSPEKIECTHSVNAYIREVHYNSRKKVEKYLEFLKQNCPDLIQEKLMEFTKDKK